MANQLTGNPKIFDTTGVISGNFGLVLIQWIDNAADIVDDDDLAFTVNGQALTYKVALTANEIGTPVIYELGPFSPPMFCRDFSLTVIDHGELHVWVS